MLNDKLDWTQKLGDAFLAQQSDVMDAVQRLRAKANAAGNLKSNEQQTVTVEQAPVNVQQNVTVQGRPAPPPTVIKIEPAQPQVVYVPTYNPTVVYGAWPYPAYPPYSYYPPGYVATTSLISFGVGMAVGAALWGGCNWGGYGGHSDVNVNVNNYNNFNHTNISNNNWQHNVDHRKGVQYRDAGTQQKYNRGASQRRQVARSVSRPRRTGPARPGARRRQGLQGQRRRRNGSRRAPGAANRPADRGGRQAGANGPADRGGRQAAANRARGSGGRQAAAERAPARAQQRAPAKSGAGAFQGMGNGQQARQDSNRGRASRQNAAATSRRWRRGLGGGGGGGRGGGGGGGRRR